MMKQHKCHYIIATYPEKQAILDNIKENHHEYLIYLHFIFDDKMERQKSKKQIFDFCRKNNIKFYYSYNMPKEMPPVIEVIL